ncbi:MAG: rhomboid family intramembrane serine protease [Acidobacteria bacterium]|nr:rhomboid family intramembrane serine protease [Acidobacteriota bacterium]
MLFPIGDDNSNRSTFPVVNTTLIVMNILVYLYQMTHPNFTYGYSVVPAEITSGRDISGMIEIGRNQLQLFRGPNPVYLTILSAMFMHGGLSHIGGNMLYLWIFGDNVEDRMGHVKYLIFYLLCGVLASVAHIAVAPNSLIPSLGASGAIAGVLGAYLVLFPRQGVRVFQFGRVVEMPALIVIGLWGLLQFINGFGELQTAGQRGGVAYMAHIGGFVAGLVLVFVFRNPDNRPYRRGPNHWR